MTGTLHRTLEGIWYVRHVTESKATPILEVIDTFLLHPWDANEKEYEYNLIKAAGYISHDVEFEITEQIDYVSQKSYDPPRPIVTKYAKLRG